MYRKILTWDFLCFFIRSDLTFLWSATKYNIHRDYSEQVNCIVLLRIKWRWGIRLLKSNRDDSSGRRWRRQARIIAIWVTPRIILSTDRYTHCRVDIKVMKQWTTVWDREAWQKCPAVAQWLIQSKVRQWQFKFKFRNRWIFKISIQFPIEVFVFVVIYLFSCVQKSKSRWRCLIESSEFKENPQLRHKKECRMVMMWKRKNLPMNSRVCCSRVLNRFPWII